MISIDTSHLPRLDNLIAGRWRPGAERIAVLDKFSGDTVAEVAQASREEVAEAVRACLAAFEAGPP